MPFFIILISTILISCAEVQDVDVIKWDFALDNFSDNEILMEEMFDNISEVFNEPVFEVHNEFAFDFSPDIAGENFYDSGIDPGSCFESPCGLSPNCGCPVGMKCSLNSSAQRECMPAGASGYGSTCISDADCAPGFICLATNSSYTTAACYKFCDTNADCNGTGSLCMPLYYNGEAISGASVCSYSCTLPPPGSGCPAGHACDLYEDSLTGVVYTDCNGEVGTGTQDSFCSEEMDCASGYFCYTVDGICLAYCYADTPSCLPGYECVELSVYLGGHSIGVCYYLI